MIIEDENYLAHYGILRRSGRYPWGSGKDQHEVNRSFIDTITSMRKQGMSDVEICRAFDIKDKDGNITDSFSTTQLRAAMSIAKNEQRAADIAFAQRLKDKGVSTTEIGRRMDRNESSVRAMLAEGAAEKASILTNISNMLQKEVDTRGLIDVGEGISYHIGISKNTLDNAVAVLREKGYAVHTVPVPQLGTGKNTNVKVLAPPGTTWGDVKKNSNDIKIPNHHTEDNGRTVLGIQPPLSIHPKRVGIRYAEDGGSEADGVIYVRPGVKDLSLGKSTYAQVRIQVGDGHYLKGMAVYKDDLPDGVDLQFNTNKSNTGNKLDAMKELKRKEDGTVDTDNPFGANISKQIIAKDSKGREINTSVMNIVNEEGDWSKWSKTLSSQMLSKQSPGLAKEQLSKAYKQREEEFKRLSSLTNPEVRRKLLIDFGDECDSAASHLTAAGLPRTHGHHVILPIPSMKPSEIYAPNYDNGERVVLIRHPHGGTFEIPELVVNNRNKEAKKILGSAPDAVGIHHSVAERLSGADFDGDTVLVIPNYHNKVKTSPPLEGLKDFDPKKEYPSYPGMKVMKDSSKGTYMGDITNLITDMTIKKAPSSEIARAVKHSMVVIDAVKHELDYKRSARENGIAQLKEKYQGGKRAGADTLISKAGAKERVPVRLPRKASLGGPIDKTTGERVFESASGYTDKNGVFHPPPTETHRKLSLAKDAHTLSSGTPMEKVYADHANRTKSLANAARKEGVNSPSIKYSPSAKKVYAEEVKKLDADLALARRNAPLERQAQIAANAVYKQRLHDNPEMDNETKKKIKFQALTAARSRFKADKTKIEITPKQWEAIQAGAVSASKLRQILANADMDIVQQLATPKPKLLTTSKKSQAKALLDNGYTRAEVAKRLGVSLSTLVRELEQ